MSKTFINGVEFKTFFGIDKVINALKSLKGIRTSPVPSYPSGGVVCGEEFTNGWYKKYGVKLKEKDNIIIPIDAPFFITSGKHQPDTSMLVMD